MRFCIKRKRVKSLVVSFLMILFITIYVNGVNVKAEAMESIVYDNGSKTLTINGKLTDSHKENIKSYKDKAEKVIIKNVKCDSCHELLAYFSKLKSVEISGLETLDTSDMFLECKNLKVIPVQSRSNENIQLDKFKEYKITYKSGESNLKDQVEILARSDKDALDYVKEEAIPGYKLKEKSIKGSVINFEYNKLIKATFKNADNSILKVQEAENLSEIVQPENPVKKQSAEFTYTFAGWEKNTDNKTGDIIYTPVFDSKINKYKYSIIYRCGEEELYKVQGEAEYNSEISIEERSFPRYSVREDRTKVLKISEKPESNVAYVEYDKTEEASINDSEINTLQLKRESNLDTQKEVLPGIQDRIDEKFQNEKAIPYVNLTENKVNKKPKLLLKNKSKKYYPKKKVVLSRKAASFKNGASVKTGDPLMIIVGSAVISLSCAAVFAVKRKRRSE